ncbi:decaprenyl-phosphate phosphoribosyltransferase [Kitasatospora sp. NBC_01287]|uniref:decaprenyl-phosphate phosphoribosyltransferase n=1 Tax=Kitasatospora sp. NBC_01287 TaxID=2903573 RepID=UPI0022548670|nr:decaprenyl-phosphate phosphoribosyltransferase [Kitasatospora sp. NBC_01287]MCX4747007.1 decaprenyl-phosphate phosphoribosyltransferase [Kitasatospora sp. NBC_01287]
MTAQPPVLPAPELRPIPTGATRPARFGLPGAMLRTARPRQWPKNLLVFAAPVAAADRGRIEGLGGALAAFAVFTLASCAVYFVNDVADAERDRQHPVKCARPVAGGELSERHALAVAVACVALAEAGALALASAGLAICVTGYLAMSFLYSATLKHLPVIELTMLASGFVLRAIGGAAAAEVAPSGWFVLVCSLGALLVALSKRYTELAGLGPAAAGHRPCLRRYTPAGLRLAQRAVSAAMIGAYLGWALLNGSDWAIDWHLVTVLPLAAALLRFDRLTGRATMARVEDLITRDGPMLGCELVWLVLFVAAGAI